MILTTCAACAAPLAHNAPRCVRCWTRYCDSTCQHDHWRRGHKQICKRIHRGGNAEKYHADKKYKEAVAVAVEACADDTKGQTCFICTQALHWKTKEGLVRGCSCRGTAGFAHVSCLAEQAKILFAEAEENNLGVEAANTRWRRWDTCSLCEQDYHGVVCCALGWACWKTYVGRQETDRELLSLAMSVLGNGLLEARRLEEALSVQEAELSLKRRFGAPEESMLGSQENNLDDKDFNTKWRRWDKCSMCEQWYHSAVACALGWACWKTYVGRPEADWPRRLAIEVLGNGLSAAAHYDDALPVREAELAMRRRLDTTEENILNTQSNLATTYARHGRMEQALRLREDVYSGTLKLHGDEHRDSLIEANNYAYSLLSLKRFAEAKTLLRKTQPVARRILGDSNETTLRMRWNCAEALYKADGATLDDLREAVKTLEETERTARRVLGGVHPLTTGIEQCLRAARAALRARETPEP
ncbi:unnamed protein product [Pelagomonas calceolata]|uniref:MYND-type domain-containing protein n=1 Tax=Pelagomonas calceolata TaxID=35677 RepID=A0A8J2SHR6_9STRA|nr:unnamed protein product [Pelagomonas calceolata]